MVWSPLPVRRPTITLPHCVVALHKASTPAEHVVGTYTTHHQRAGLEAALEARWRRWRELRAAPHPTGAPGARIADWLPGAVDALACAPARDALLRHAVTHFESTETGARVLLLSDRTFPRLWLSTRSTVRAELGACPGPSLAPEPRAPMSVAECKALCAAQERCGCVTYSSAGRCCLHESPGAAGRTEGPGQPSGARQGAGPEKWDPGEARLSLHIEDPPALPQRCATLANGTLACARGDGVVVQG